MKGKMIKQKEKSPLSIEEEDSLQESPGSENEYINTKEDQTQE